MGSVWCVTPEDVQVDLVYAGPDGSRNSFWIKVKRQLTVGEERRVMTAGWRGLKQGAKPRPGEEAEGAEIAIDWRLQSLARTEVYLTDWSLTDDKNNKLAHDRETIESLHPDVFALIEGAINDRVKAAEAEKKATPGSAAPLAISA